MRHQVAALLCSAALLIGTDIAAAQGPGSSAHLMERFGSGLRIDTSYVAADGCQAMLRVLPRQAPSGIALSHEVIPVTVVIGPDPRGCTGQRVLRRVFNIGGGSLMNLVRFYFVSETGQLLDTETVAVETGW